jgi:hypothetical protein
VAGVIQKSANPCPSCDHYSWFLYGMWNGEIVCCGLLYSSNVTIVDGYKHKHIENMIIDECAFCGAVFSLPGGKE